jgi:hypothetical protein
MTTKRTTLSEDARRRREFVLQGTAAERNEAPPSPPAPKQDPPKEEPTVNQSYRMPKSLVNRLRRAVLERKNAGVQPSSANAIAAEALARWLDEEEKRTRMQG